MKNEHIPPNPYPVKPPPNMPAPRKESLEAEVARLKAEVERLTKAGDAMEMILQADFNGCPYEPTIVREAIIYWRNAKHAAKEGKQS